MARGKQTCKILKEIRRQIAASNDIEFVTSECRHKGDCPGTCPKCEAEVRYLEQQLRTRSLSGRAVALAGISAGMILMSGSCSTSSVKSSRAEQDDYDENYVVDVSVDDDDDDMDMGEVMFLPDYIIIAPEEIGDADDIRIQRWTKDSVAVKPQFPGGLEAMERFINEQYSKEKEQVISYGTMDLIIGRNGKVAAIRAEGPYILGDQLLKIVKQFPDFTPAEKDGKRVPVKLTVSLKILESGVEIYRIEYFYSPINKIRKH